MTITPRHPNVHEGRRPAVGAGSPVTILGYQGCTTVMIGNTCEATMQVGKDELEVLVENIADTDNLALTDGKARGVAKGYTRQVLAKVRA
ncbi:hypothetical protein ABZ901_10810 [Actinacidiphila alni]|uniref:hypothetical protein n=1 Tax=Actinacidiphila alni TaxID=380248 RepID=UPI0033CDC85A